VKNPVPCTPISWVLRSSARALEMNMKNIPHTTAAVDRNLILAFSLGWT
jgi:hypothetical protein